MGFSYSLEKTALYESLINKKFRTKVPFEWTYGNKWRIHTFDPNTTILGDVSMVIKEPIEFTITNIIRDDDNGFHIIIHIDKLIPLRGIVFNRYPSHFMPGIQFGSTEFEVIDNVSMYIYPFSPKTGIVITRHPTETYNVNIPAVIDSKVLEPIL